VTLGTAGRNQDGVWCAASVRWKGKRFVRERKSRNHHLELQPSRTYFTLSGTVELTRLQPNPQPQHQRSRMTTNGTA
jgi:hypothetical protein